MALNPDLHHLRPDGFVLPVLLLLVSLAAMLAATVAGNAMLAGRTAQALLARRQAFEAAENAIHLALQTAATRTAPWAEQAIAPGDIRIATTVRPLGTWTTGAADAGRPAEENHVRITVTATTRRGARSTLEQDCALPAPDGLTAPAAPRRTVWRELDREPAP